MSPTRMVAGFSPLMRASEASRYREWVNFTRERMEQNFNRFESLLRCRTPQDLAAVQSEFLRDNLESFLQCARRIAEASMQMADEATKRTAEAVEQARAA